LAPTTSTTMQLALGDALAVALLERRNFTPSDFKNFHPGGKLGASLSQVKDVMHMGDALPLTTANVRMDQALLLMTEKGFGCLGIVDDQNLLIGVITDGDLRRHMSADFLDKLTGDIMTPDPRTIASRKLTAEALNIMNENKIQCLFVCDAAEHPKNPVGLVRVLDLLRIGTA
jgi:arabinose-5-phosphate isomerase